MSKNPINASVSAQGEEWEKPQHSRRAYEVVVANMPAMIYRAVRHVNGNVEFFVVSEGCRTLFGIAPEQLQADGLLLRRMVHPEDRERYDAVSALANQQAQPWYWQGRFVLPSSEQKYVQAMGHPDPQENGDVIWDGFMMDVTERVQAEHKATQLAAIVEGSNDAILGKTLAGIVTSWNGAAERLYGYTADEIIGQALARLLPPDRPHEVDDLLKRIAGGERVQSYETVRKAKDGTLLDVALTVSPIKDGTGCIVGASTIAHDIGHQKKIEAQVHQQMLRIQALRNIDMAITASLDLRVTLNVLLDQVTTLLHVDSASVLLLNPHTYRLEYCAGRGFRTAALQRTQLRMGEGYAGRAALERRMVNISNLSQVGADFKRASLIVGEDFVSYWAVPLITKGRVEGVLEMFHRAPLLADSDWLNFLDALAGQAAIAIENAALFSDLQRTNVDLQLAYDNTLEGWSKALDLRDKETEGHTLRVTEATMILALAMNIPDSDSIHMRRGALLHDIGKMGVPDSILLKPDALTEEEWVIMKKHPVYAYELLSPIHYLRLALDIPYCHHEKWDGSGYPRGLRGEQIPLSARIFAVVDVWDALRSDRPYRAAWPAARVRDHIARGSGSHFEPRVAESFLDMEI